MKWLRIKRKLLFNEAAAEKAAQGSESTKEMKSVHGRAAYYVEQSIGSVVGKLIFEALA